MPGADSPRRPPRGRADRGRDGRPPPPPAAQPRPRRADRPTGRRRCGRPGTRRRGRATRSRSSSTARRRCREIERAIRGARRHVHIAGWSITPHFARHARRAARPPARTARRHGGARAGPRADVGGRAARTRSPPTAPRRATRATSSRAGRRSARRATRARARLHCHHEKLVIVDDEVAFVGGIDLTLLGGRPWDTNAHPARGRLGWHDAASRLRGPAVADVAAHFAAPLDRGRAGAGRRTAARRRGPRATPTVQVVRTVPERQYDFAPRRRLPHPRGVRPRAALRASGSSTSRASSSGRPRSSTCSRPSCATRRPTRSASSSSCPRARTTAGGHPRPARGPRRADATQPLPRRDDRARTGRTIDRLYVHAKIGIVDDRWLTIGSANLNAHSLFNDSEMNVVTCDPGARARHAAAAVGRAPGARRRRRRRRPGRAWSTSCGARSRSSSSRARAAATCEPTG